MGKKLIQVSRGSTCRRNEGAENPPKFRDLTAAFGEVIVLDALTSHQRDCLKADAPLPTLPHLVEDLPCCAVGRHFRRVQMSTNGGGAMAVSKPKALFHPLRQICFGPLGRVGH